MSSLETPAASAANVVMQRWRSTGSATAVTSPVVQWWRPMMTARAFAALMSARPARGPAPQPTISRT